MSLDLESRRMSRMLRAATRSLVLDLIEVADEENVRVYRQPPRHSTRTRSRVAHSEAASKTLSGRLPTVTVKQFVDARSAAEQAELMAIMQLGRTPFGISAAEFAVLCEPDTPPRRDLGQYLASKGHLATWLERGLDRLGL